MGGDRFEPVYGLCDRVCRVMPVGWDEACEDGGWQQF